MKTFEFYYDQTMRTEIKADNVSKAKEKFYIAKYNSKPELIAIDITNVNIIKNKE